MTTPRACHCLFAHPVNDQERADLAESIRHARQIGDLDGLRIHLVRLTTAPNCPARSEGSESPR